MIAVIDYGAGNLQSVKKALDFISVESVITDNPQTINDCDKILLPGVGSFGDASTTSFFPAKRGGYSPSNCT